MTINSPFPSGSSVVAYLRDSGGDDQDLSTDQQEAAIRTWCDENHLVLTRVFSDMHRPGSTTVGRLEFERMINYFRGKPPEAGLVLWAFSRFARDLNDAQFFKTEIRRNGYLVHSLKDNIPEGIWGGLIEYVNDMTNQQYLINLSQDIKRGLYFMVKNYGGVPGVPPRGFKREQLIIGKRVSGAPHIVHRWVPDPETFPLCQKAWQLRAAGKSIEEIHSTVPLYGSITSWGTFFNNRIYLGELKFGDQLIENYVPAAVDKATWENIHKTRIKAVKSDTGSPDHPRRQNSAFLLSGLLFCARCQKLMNGDVRISKGKVYHYYVCGRKAFGHNECQAEDIRQEVLERSIVKELIDQVLEINYIYRLIGENKGMETLPSEIKITETALAAIKRKIDNVVEAIADRGLDDKLNEKLTILEKEQVIKTRDLAMLKTAVKKRINFDKDQIKLILDGMRQALESTDYKRQRAALKTFIRRILVDRTGEKINCSIEFMIPEEKDMQGESCGNTMPPTWGTFHRHNFSVLYRAYSRLSQ